MGECHAFFSRGQAPWLAYPRRPTAFDAFFSGSVCMVVGFQNKKTLTKVCKCTVVCGTKPGNSNKISKFFWMMDYNYSVLGSMKSPMRIPINHHGTWAVLIVDMWMPMPWRVTMISSVDKSQARPGKIGHLILPLVLGGSSQFLLYVATMVIVSPQDLGLFPFQMAYPPWN